MPSNKQTVERLSKCDFHASTFFRLATKIIYYKHSMIVLFSTSSKVKSDQTFLVRFSCRCSSYKQSNVVQTIFSWSEASCVLKAWRSCFSHTFFCFKCFFLDCWLDVFCVSLLNIKRTMHAAKDVVCAGKVLGWNYSHLHQISSLTW